MGQLSKSGPPLPYGLTMFAGVPFLTTAYNLRRFGWRQFVAAWNGSRTHLILAAVLGVIAYLLALFAYNFALLSYSGAIREVSVVMGRSSAGASWAKQWEAHACSAPQPYL